VRQLRRVKCKDAADWVVHYVILEVRVRADQPMKISWN